MFNVTTITLALAFLISSTTTFAASEKSDFALGLGLGTTGISLSGTYKINNHFNVRGIYAHYGLDEQETESGILYDFDIKLQTITLLLDYHPFASSGFRFSAGVVKNGTEFNATSTQTTGTINVGNSTFAAADVGTLNANVDYGSVAPYVGIGWGNAVLKDRNLSLALDIGVMAFEDPTVTMTSTGGNAAVNAELANERRELEESLDDFDLYPVVNLSLNYKF